MGYLLTSLFINVICLFAAHGESPTHDEVAQEYLRNVIDSPNYDKRIRPYSGTKPGSPVDVKVTMYILDIARVDEEKMEYDVQFYFRQAWLDKRLKSTKYNISSVMLRDVDKIWTPDVFFVSDKQGSKLHDVTGPNMFCRIAPRTGDVFFSVRVTERMPCNMNLRKFPFDIQECLLRAESYGYSHEHINFKINPYAVSATKEISSSDFKLLEYDSHIKVEYFTTGNYSALEIDLKLKRDCGYFISKLFVPSIILVILSWVSFWISPRQKYLRLALLLVILYLMVTVASESDSRSPYAPYAKASDVWIGFCEAMIVLLFLEFIAVCVIADEPKREIITNLDPESKEFTLSNDLKKTSLEKFITVLDMKTGRGKSDATSGLDRISKVIFPIVFIIFNIVFWSVYAS